jgi:hypothetical protein
VRERTVYLTADEVEAASKLHQRVPIAICDVSGSQFSIARHYGCCTFNGCAYTYLFAEDELIRNDVLKMVAKMRKRSKAQGQTGRDQVAEGRQSRQPVGVRLQTPVTQRPTMGRRTAK